MKRRWFQLHLSTCVVLMFVAGGLIWANAQVRTQAIRTGELTAIRHERGWPLTCWHVITDWTEVELSALVDITVLDETEHLNLRPAALNVVISFVTLSLVAFILERNARRSTP
ncbi:MAG TPA: hypothetical protein VEK08_04560 [Planctomycetota bacterium]|nr:hypothetical protein [Planctomycetota bacterium]